MEGFTTVGKIGELAPGEMKMVEVSGEEILIANINGEFYAVSDVCTHAEASLSDGTLEDNHVECALHGSVFNVATGEEIEGPTNGPLRRYEICIEGDDILVNPH